MHYDYFQEKRFYAIRPSQVWTSKKSLIPNI